MILLFSKLDLFQEKVSQSPVKQYFPEYMGAEDDIEAVRDMFVNKFLTIARKGGRDDIRIYYTDLTDTDSFWPILKDIEASIRDDHDVDGEYIGQSPLTATFLAFGLLFLIAAFTWDKKIASKCLCTLICLRPPRLLSSIKGYTYLIVSHVFGD